MEIIKFHNKTLNDDLKEIIENDYIISRGPVSGNSIEVLYDSTSVSLTIGKVYDVIEIVNIPFSPSRYDDYSGPRYKIVNDNDEVSSYSDECVRTLTLDELRELKLEDLGI
jgi:hypothetical protein